MIRQDAAMPVSRFCELIGIPRRTYTRWRARARDGVTGKGQYVGTYMAWGAHNSGWWGEGEIKFYLDGDGEFPTVQRGITDTGHTILGSDPQGDEVTGRAGHKDISSNNFHDQRSFRKDCQV